MMFGEVLFKLRENLHFTDEDYKNITEFKKNNSDIEEIKKEIEDLKQKRLILNKNVESFNMINRIFNKSYRETVNELEKNKIILDEKVRQLSELIKKNDSYHFEDGLLDKFQRYNEITKVIDSYNNGDLDAVVEYIAKEFGDNYKNVFDFCNEHGILLDFSTSKEEKMLDLFNEKNTRFGRNLISSLDDMFLVRRTDYIPINDELIAPIKNATKEVTNSLVIDGKEVSQFNASVPHGHCTIHFAINQEVMPHKDAPDGWNGKKMTILQPLTETLYQSAISFEPIDCFFDDMVKLNNYYLICDDKKIAEDFLKKNNGGIPIIAREGQVNGFGNKILRAMGVPCPYKIYDGQSHDGNYPLETYYTKEFLEKYPRVVKDVDGACGNSIHDLYKQIQNVVFEFQYVDEFANFLLSKCESFESALNKFQENYVRNNKGGSNYLHYNDDKLSFANYMQGKYQDEAKFVDFLSSYYYSNQKRFDPQIVFEKICEGIDKESIDELKLKRIKENVINIISSSSDIDHDVRGAVDSLVLLFKFLRTNITKLNTDKIQNGVYCVPIKWYDLNKKMSCFEECFNQFETDNSLWKNYGDILSHQQQLGLDFTLDHSFDREFEFLNFMERIKTALELEEKTEVESSLKFEVKRRLSEYNLEEVIINSKDDISKVVEVIYWLALLEHEQNKNLSVSHSK